MCPLSTGSLSLKTQMAENQGNIHCLVEAPRVPNTLHICDISYKSQVLLRILDGVPMTNPHHTDDSTARRDFGVHHKIPSAVWDHDTQEENRNTVKTVTAASRKHPWKLKTDREGENKQSRYPFCNPIAQFICMVSLVAMHQDAAREGIPFLSLEPIRRGDKRTMTANRDQEGLISIILITK